jgi:predicted DCC family thiol-disulfide oxidoreductase YuxK
LVLDKSEKIYQKSDPIRVIANQLVLLRCVGLIIWIIPTFISNKLYDVIVRNRYRFFGNHKTCPFGDEKRIMKG